MIILQEKKFLAHEEQRACNGLFMSSADFLIDLELFSALRPSSHLHSLPTRKLSVPKWEKPPLSVFSAATIVQSSMPESSNYLPTSSSCFTFARAILLMKASQPPRMRLKIRKGKLKRTGKRFPVFPNVPSRLWQNHSARMYINLRTSRE